MWNFWRRKQRDADLDEEIAFDLALDAEERTRSGMSREEAERSSRRDFGNVGLVKEGIRDIWGWTSFERLGQDLRYGWRTLRNNPLFTAMAVLSLALGIGANTAIYSFMDAILMRSLPVQHPEELVIFKWHSKAFPRVVHALSGSWDNDPHAGSTSGSYPFPAFELLRANNTTLASLFAFEEAGRLHVMVHGQAELAEGLLVSGGFFSALDVAPAAGRLITDEDDRMGAASVVVISRNYWQRRFAASPGAVGQSILINNRPFTIAGVSAPGFFGVNPEGAPELFIPLHAPLLATNPQRDAEGRFLNKNRYWVEIMGRLRPGINLQQAQTELAAQFHQFVSATASTEEEKANLPMLLLSEGGSGIDSLRRQYSKPLYVLMTLVGLILAIACANIASLLLARATARRREMAVRLSLGAGRLRVIRQLLTESVLLSSMGGLLGVCVAAAGIRFITWLLANGRSNFTLHASLNWPVLGFAFALALITGLLFGLAPAIQATKVDLTPALKETRASVPRGRLRLSSLLVISQIAVALLLIIAAGLFVRTLSNLHSVELGFNRENVLLFSLNAKPAGYKDAALAGFYADLRTRFRAIPGVREVSLSNFPLVSGAGAQHGVTIPGVPAPPGREPGTSVLKVGPSFLTAMQIPVLLGREIQERDMTGSAKFAVVNEIFAKKYFAGERPIGRRFGLSEDGSADIEIIGVAKSARYNSLKRDIPPLVYVPFTQDLRGLSGVSFELRTAGDPLALVSTVRQIVSQSDPRVPISNINTQSRQIDQTINQERTFAQLCTSFAVLALLISCVGLYGTMAYNVARRTSEIGIRMALGAERRRVIWMVLREVCLLAAAGLTVGLAMAWSTTRYVQSFLFGIKHNDALSMSLSVVILIAALIVAGYAPASRASRIDPITALRHE
jgi:macrolide transport system ATP-binding/permease protein